MPLIPQGDFTFLHTNQPDTPSVSPTALKTQWDTQANELKTTVNNLIIALEKTTATSGAEQIGSLTIASLTGTTIYAQVLSLRDQLKSITANSSGADFIAVTAIAGLAGGTVQSLLVALKALSDNLQNQITSNLSAQNAHKAAAVLDHPDLSVTTAKIADLAITTAKIAAGIDAAKIGTGVVSNAEFATLDGVTSAVQTQLDGKTPLTHVGSGGTAHANVVAAGAAGFMTGGDKTKLDGIAAGAEVNQNAFSKLAIAGQADVDADSKTDTLNLAGGTGISISTDPATDTVTFTATGTSVPGAHATTHVTGGADVIPNAVPNGNAGLMSGADKAKANAATVTEVGYLSGVTSNIQTQMDAKLASSAYTAADVLAKVKTVDGPGSGLDADTVKGYVPVNQAGDTMIGALTAAVTTGVLGNATGNSKLEVKGGGAVGDAAYMDFHRPGAFAAHFGIDTDNKWKVGGWSMGAVAYEVWHDNRLRVKADNSGLEAFIGGVWTDVGNRVDRTAAALFSTAQGTISLTAGAAYTTLLSITGKKGFLDSAYVQPSLAVNPWLRITVDGVVKVELQGGSNGVGFSKRDYLFNGATGNGLFVSATGTSVVDVGGVLIGDYPAPATPVRGLSTAPDAIYFTNSLLIETKSNGTGNHNYSFMGGSY